MAKIIASVATAISLVAVAVSISGCGGGSAAATPPPKLAGPGGQVVGGGQSVVINGVTFSHDQAAAAFLTALNVESANQTTTEQSCDDYGNCTDVTVSSPGPVYSVTKSDTLESGYAVINDGAGHYSAIYIDGWNGSDPMNYYSGNGSTFTNLTNLGNGNFQDAASGILFQASKPSTKDLEKQVAFFESLAIQKSAKAMQGYGFSEDRSLEVAKLASQLEKAPKGSMTDKDYDNFAQQITGSTIGAIKAAMQKQVAGDSSSLKNIIDTAAETNGVGSEQMKQMLGKVVGHPVVN